MEIRLDAHICSTCANSISLYGYPCRNLIDLACSYYLNQKTLTFTDREINDPLFKTPLQFLERKGFLISTEIGENQIQIIPRNSKNSYEYGDMRFCWC